MSTDTTTVAPTLWAPPAATPLAPEPPATYGMPQYQTPPESTDATPTKGRRWRIGVFAGVLCLLVAAFIGAGLTASTSVQGTPTASPARMVVVNAGDRLVKTMDKYFTGRHQLVNNTVNVSFSVASTPGSQLCAQMFADLGFDPSANVLMDNTSGNDGIQTTKSPNYTAIWTYSARVGLDLTISVNSGI